MHNALITQAREMGMTHSTEHQSCGIAVVVCTEHRGVFFGVTDDIYADPIALRDCRMCIYWSSAIGGVMGLADIGPVDAGQHNGSRIGARVSWALLRGITAVIPASEAAAAAWIAAPTHGRSK